MRDFTYDMYATLCSAALSAGYAPMTISTYLAVAARPQRCLIMRHDIDRLPRRALALAEIEARLGIAATYYVRMTRHAFDPVVIRRLAALGHEIGYHYETLARARGEVARALDEMRLDLQRLRALVPVDTAAMHGSPLSPIDNRAIWQHATLAEFELRGEAYLSLDYTTMGYYTDTGRSWAADAANRRDRPAGAIGDFARVDNTAALSALVASGRYSALCIQTHPERWSGTVSQWLVSWTMDSGANLIKLALAASRGQWS